jgi:hypothetical protein
MACAIFNPFCCCTAGLLSLDDEATTQVVHSCCQSQSSDQPTGGESKQSHDRAECPHAALKDYEAVAHRDMTSADQCVALLPAILVVGQLLSLEAMPPAPLLVAIDTVSHAPPKGFEQVYCVYRV